MQTSPPIKHEDKILEAIDQMRRRKARPDADRICNYLLRKYSVDARDTISDLHRLIETEKVIQVDYKGNVSYRNASKWSRLNTYKNKPEVFVRDRLNSCLVSGAVGELVIEEPDYLDQGVPPNRLTEQILEGLNNFTSRRVVEDFLAKEVVSGNLNRLPNGNYSLVSTADMVATTESSQIISTATTTTTATAAATNKRKNSCPFVFVDVEPEEEAKPSLEVVVPKPVQVKMASIKQEELVQKVESTQPQQQQSGKKRKQRLMVRKDDPIEMFENFGKENLVKEMDKKDEKERFSDEREDDEMGRSSANPSPTLSNNVGGFRSARRKRAKKVFDPSDNNVVKRKRGKYATQNKAVATAIVSYDSQDSIKLGAKDGPNRTCSVCSKDKAENLVACRDCTSRAHPTCIYTAEELLVKINSGWQCERCKSCVVCCETSDAGPLMTCSVCDEAYHHMCHSPRISAPKQNTKWSCGDCSAKSHQTKQNNTGGISMALIRLSNSQSSSSSETRSVSPPSTVAVAAILPPVLSPQVSPPRSDADDKSEIKDIFKQQQSIDPNIPDASDWTTEQVYQYFARLFPKEAETFRNHEIDGHALLMLKRSDVLTSLDLLLGPALKIYRHVVKLQARRDDTSLYWL